MGNPITDVATALFGGDKSVSDKTGLSDTSQKGTINDTTQSTTATNQTSQTGTVSATEQKQVSDSSTVSRMLSDQQIAAGSTVLDKLSAAAGPVDLTALTTRVQGADNKLSSGAEALFARAQSADATLAQGSDAIVGAARQNLAKATATQTNSLAGGAGTKFDSVVQKAFAETTGANEVQLAGLAGTLAAQNRQQATNELLSAVSALKDTAAVTASNETALPIAAASINAQNAGGVSNLLNALKGGLGTTTSHGVVDTSGRTESQSTTNSVINSVVNSTNNRDLNINTNAVTVGKDITNSDTTLLDLLTKLPS